MTNTSHCLTTLRLLRNKLRNKVDELVLFKKARWASFALCVLLFVYRMVALNGFYAMAYLMGFYIIQKVILFVTPSGIPSIQDEEDESVDVIYDIPEHKVVAEKDEDSKPIVRRLGEFSLW